MGIQERRLREREDLRHRIVEAAADLFVREGYEQVSIRKIADRIEYAPSTIYLYFKDKAEIVNSVCEETFSKLTDALEAITGQALPPLEMLRKALRAYIDFGLAHPNHYVAVLCLPEPEHSSTRPMEAGLHAFDLLRKGLRGCMEAGVIRHQDIETTSQTTWMMLHGVTSLLITSRSFPFVEREKLIEFSLDRILGGLK